VHAGLGHTSWITAAAVAMVSTNPYGDNNELKFNKRPTLIAEVFHIFIDVNMYPVHFVIMLQTSTFLVINTAGYHGY